MSQTRRIYTLIILITLFSISCATADVDKGEVNKLRDDINKNVNLNVDPNANVAEDNEAELTSLINLPFEPEENVYRVDQPNGSANNSSAKNGNKLTAVLKFNSDDAEKLVEEIKSKGVIPEAKIDPEPWFPAELIAKSQTSGDESIKGIGYKADVFYKNPYTSGTLTRVNDTDYFVLILHSQ